MHTTIKNTTLHFLRDIEKNNNREWFNENKERYTDAQTNVLSFVEDLILEMGKFDEKILKLDAKKSLFRIYRDTRFSHNKDPYKTNFGSSLGIGKGSQKAGYYLHIEPGKSFLAGGIYMPESSVLKEIRKEISMNGEEFLKILDAKSFRNNFRGLSVEGKLKRVPNGFEKDDPMAEFLKLKNFIVIHPVADADLAEPHVCKIFAKIYHAMQPLNNFLNAPFL